MKRALILGCTGQDGSYLAELLLAKRYEVHGTKRRSSSLNTSRIDHLMNEFNFRLHYADVLDLSSLVNLMSDVDPDEVYNLAAQSHVGLSFEMPHYTVESIVTGTLNALIAFQHCSSLARFYQASSSEMYGNTKGPLDEDARFAPVSPYGCAKLAAHHLAVSYRNAYNLHVSCGILFNHESPRRGETFVTRKITRGLARIKAGLQETLALGNLDAIRDWGYAPEYVDAMWRMLQQDEPGDYVIGTGQCATVGDFLNEALRIAGLDRSCVIEDQRHLRRNEVNLLLAHPAKAKRVLGWEPTVTWRGLASGMMVSDMAAVNREAKACAA